MSARIVTLSLHDALPIFFGVVKNIGRADDVMKKSVRRGNAGAERKMIDEFVAEKRFGCKLFDLLRVFSVIGYRAGLRLSKAGTRKQTQRKQKTRQDPHHRPPQGKNLARGGFYSGGSRNLK